MRKLSNENFGGGYLKTKVTVLCALFIAACFFVCSCGSEVISLENFCFAVRDFDLAKAEKYVADDTEGYFRNVRSLAEELTEEQAKTAKAIYSHMAFSDFAEDGGAYTVTVKYVDFAALINAVNVESSTGASSLETLSEIVESGRLQKQFMKTQSGVRVEYSADSSESTKQIKLGYSGINSDFTRLLGLDTFLRWYSLQR